MQGMYRESEESAGSVGATEAREAREGAMEAREAREAREGGSADVPSASKPAKTVKRQAGGLFAAGTAPGPGRPKQVDNRDYIAAIKQGFPPDKIVELLNEAIEIAISTNSWRGVVAAAEFAAAYSLGKPKQRVETSDGAALADLLAQVDASKPLLADNCAGSSGVSGE